MCFACLFGAKSAFFFTILEACIHLYEWCFSTSVQDKCLCTFLTVCLQSHPRFCCSSIQQTRQHTYSHLPQGWRVALLLSHMPSMVSHFTTPDSPVWPLSVKRTPLSVAPPTQMHAHIDVCERMWLEQNNSFYPRHTQFCIHNRSAFPS